MRVLYWIVVLFLFILIVPFYVLAYLNRGDWFLLVIPVVLFGFAVVGDRMLAYNKRHAP